METTINELISKIQIHIETIWPNDQWGNLPKDEHSKSQLTMAYRYWITRCHTPDDLLQPVLGIDRLDLVHSIASTPLYVNPAKSLLQFAIQLRAFGSIGKSVAYDHAVDLIQWINQHSYSDNYHSVNQLTDHYEIPPELRWAEQPFVQLAVWRFDALRTRTASLEELLQWNYLTESFLVVGEVALRLGELGYHSQMTLLWDMLIETIPTMLYQSRPRMQSWLHNVLELGWASLCYRYSAYDHRYAQDAIIKFLDQVEDNPAMSAEWLSEIAGLLVLITTRIPTRSEIPQLQRFDVCQLIQERWAPVVAHGLPEYSQIIQDVHIDLPITDHWMSENLI